MEHTSVTDNEVTGTHATYARGGGLYLAQVDSSGASDRASIAHSLIARNRVRGGSGGGLSVSRSGIRFYNTTIRDNHAAYDESYSARSYGGGLHLHGYCSSCYRWTGLEFQSSRIEGNVALSGSVLHAEEYTPFTFDAATLLGWQLGGGGDATWIGSSPVSLLSGDAACPHDPLYHAACSASGTRLYGVDPIAGEPPADGCLQSGEYAQACGPINPNMPPPIVPPPSPPPPPTPPTPPPEAGASAVCNNAPGGGGGGCGCGGGGVAERRGEGGGGGGFGAGVRQEAVADGRQAAVGRVVARAADWRPSGTKLGGPAWAG